MMTNSSNGEGIFQELLERLIGNTHTPVEWEGYVPYQERPPLKPLPEPRVVALSEEALNRFVGRYRAEGQPVRTIARRDNRLTLAEDGDPEAIALEPASEDTFYTNAIDGPVRFERDEGGHVVAMRMLRWPGRYVRID
jgi:Domain of unknown function (DUF3471)